MNPDVLLAEKDVLKRPLFRDDNKLFARVMSEEFQDILRTDPTSEDGEAKVVHYFDIADEWAKVKKKGTNNGHISDSASTYFFLLLTVKYRSNTDNIWMSFYEGLHRHAALLLSLTSSSFNLTKNEIKFKSLTSEFFCQQQIENFKFDSKKPHERLSDIFDGKKKVSMLTEQFNIKAIIPKPVKWPITKNSVEDFTNKITKYSELISISKKTSAENSISSLLSKTLLNDQQMSNPEKRNQTTSRPNLFHTYKIQGQVKRELHVKKMKQFDLFGGFSKPAKSKVKVRNQGRPKTIRPEIVFETKNLLSSKNISNDEIMQKLNLSKSTFYLHLKECEFRFNHRGQDLSRLILQILRNRPLN